MQIDLKTAIGFALGLLIMVLVGVSSYIGIQQTTESNRMVTHSHDVIEKLEHALSQLKDAETGQRGFLLTGEERYLEPFNAAVAEIGKTTDSLASLIKDDPAQQQSLQQFMLFSREKLNELQQTIKLSKEDGMEAALAVVKTDRGKHIMDETRRNIAQMEAHEWMLLGSRNRIVNEVELRNSRLLGIGMLLTVLVLSLVAIVMTRSVRLRKLDIQTKSNVKKWSGVIIRYFFALAMVALAMQIRQWVVSSFGPLPVFIMFYPAIILVAIIAGGGPGIFATVLAVLVADYWYIPPIGSFAIKNPNEAITLGIFSSASMFLCLFAERLNRARVADAISVSQQENLALLDMGNLLILNPDRRIVYWSKGSGRLYGYDAEEVQGRLIHELLQTRTSQPREQITNELLKHDYWEGELTRRSKSGTEVSLAIMLALRRDDKNNPLAILEVSTDITALKRAEDTLKENESHFRTIVNAMPQLAWTARADGHIFWYNQRWYDYTGTVPEQMEGWGWQSVHDPSELSKVLERWQASIATAEPFDMTFPLRGADGVFRRFLTRIIPLKDAAGCVLQWFGTNTDVDDLKRMEQALREQREGLRVTLKSIGDAVVTCDTDGLVNFINPVAEALTGWSFEEAWERPIGDIFRLINEQTRQLTVDPVALVLREGRPKVLDNHTVLVTREGREIPIEDSAAPILDTNGQVIGVILVFHDVTEKRRAEEALQQAKDVAQAATQAKQHSLDALETLAAELSMSEERERRRIALTLHDHVVQNLAIGKLKLDVVLQKGQVAHGPVLHELQEILDTAMLDLRDLSFDLSPPILYDLGLGAAFVSLGEKFSKKYGFRFIFRPGYVTENICEDLKISVYQFFRELLTNTLKHADAETVTVLLRQEANQLMLSVDDDGKGFDSSNCRDGFGLANIRQRVNYLRGELQIRSTPGVGTRVVISIDTRYSEKLNREETDARHHPFGR